MSTPIAFHGTLQLLDWSETKRGQKVVFEVMLDPEQGEQEHPFKKFTTREGKTAGQLFAAVLVEIDPATGDPKAPPGPKAREKKSWDEMKPSQRAYLLCGDGDFEAFALERRWLPRNYILHECDIESRSDLDTNLEAQGKFFNIEQEFNEWKRVNRSVTL